VKAPPGLSLQQKGDTFTLRLARAGRRTITMNLSVEDVRGLRETIAIWSSRILSQRRAGSGQVEPIFVHAVASVRLLPEALNERVLLTVVVPTGEQMTLALPQAIAEHIAAEIPSVLAEMRASKLNKQ
jgi:hypothetical protein